MLDAGPDDDGLYHIYQLRYGEVTNRTARENFMRPDMADVPMPLDFYVWVVRNKHRTMLVDTGFSPRAAKERGYALAIDPMEALTRIGLPPEEITDAIVSHMHFDHAGNLDKLPRACLHVQDKEAAFATGRCMCFKALRAPFDVEDAVHLVRRTFAGQVRHHDGDQHVFPGISVHHLPGHSRGVQGVRVMTPRGAVLLASDATHFYANVARRQPFSGTVEVGDTLDSYEKMLRIAGDIQHLIPGHDPLVRTLYPTITVGGQELAMLHETPKPHDEAMLAKI
jgi:glyoxylase-like metal-dependent hydrolase (beta-lactamase superfamily II)